MSAKVGCFSCLGLFSLIGVFFYSACAIMISNRNQVFITKKMEQDSFTITDDELNTRLMTLIYVIIVSEIGG